MKLMSKFVNVLELSLASAEVPALSAFRREMLGRIENPIKRLGAIALHETAIRYPAATARLIGRSPMGKDLAYVGAGSESVVFRVGDDVIKVNHGTIDMCEADRQAVAAQKSSDHYKMRAYLSDFLIDQDINVGRHPCTNRLRAVRIIQPFCDITDLNLFRFEEEDVDTAVLADSIQTYPGLDDALHDFSLASKRMYEDVGLLPDTCGPCNLVIQNSLAPELTLIDGQPIGLNNSPIQAKILNNLESLDLALREVA